MVSEICCGSVSALEDTRKAECYLQRSLGFYGDAMDVRMSLGGAALVEPAFLPCGGRLRLRLERTRVY